MTKLTGLKHTLEALTLLLVLAGVAVIVAYMAQNPLPVTLTWGPTQLETQAYVVVALGAVAALTLFYLGQLVGWLQNLPQRFRNTQAQSRRDALVTAAAQTLAAEDAGQKKQAKGWAKKLEIPHLSVQETALAHLLRLHHGLLEGQEAEDALENPLSGPLVARSLARTAARHANWAEVRRLTTLGLKTSPEDPVLLTLGFKALLNLNDPTAPAWLPRLKPQLGPSAYTLLEGILNGITSPKARQLDHAWVKAFQAWIPTAEETFPVFHSQDSL